MSDWKSEFYSRYSFNFNRDIAEDTYNAFIPYGKYIVNNYFPSDKNISILDLGCGIGGFLKVFLTEGYQNIEGIDISDEDISIGRKFGLEQLKYGDFIINIRKYNDQKYDVILLLDVIEHFTNEIILEIWREVFRLLKPGGKVIIHVPNAEGIFCSKIRYSDITHETAFTSNSLSQLAKYSGFEKWECYEDKPLAYSFTGFIRRMSWNIFTIPVRIIHMIETGVYSVKLSQNILFIACKPKG